MADGGGTGLGFLKGGGEMGARMRAHDWSRSPLGQPETWPESLRAVVALMLNSRFPMFLAWGPELGFLYNDVYVPMLGNKDADALGRRFEDVWSDIWADILPLVNGALSGEASYFEDLPLVMERKGYPEQTWFTFSYSPVRDESGAVAGMFCACTETTGKVQAERKMAAERDRLSEMFEQAPGFIAMLEGPDHHFTLANAAYRRLIGGRDVVGMPIVEALPEVAGQGYFEMLDGVLASGEAVSLRAAPVELTPEGGGPVQRRFVDFIYQPVRDAAGAVTGVFCEGQDVTEKVQADQAIRDSEEQFRVFAQAVPGQIWASRPDGYLYWFNEKVYAYAGLSEGELDGVETWAEIVHPDDVAAAGEAWGRSLTTGEPYQSEFRIRRHDGAWRWFVVRAEPVRDAAGVITRWVGGNIDIDDMRQATEALAGSEARKSILLEVNGRLAALNEPAEISFAAAEILAREMGVDRAGYGLIDPRPETITIERDWNAPGVQSLAGVLQFRDYGSYIENLKRGETVVISDAREDPRTADGAAALEGINARSFVNMPVTEEGSFVALLYLNHGDRRDWLNHGDRRDWTEEEIGLIRDVANVTRSAVERRRAEEALRALNATLEARVDAEVSQRLKTEDALHQSQKMETVGQLTGGVAHDFNNLLTPIVGALDMLQRRPDNDARSTRLIDGALTAADRAKTLVHRLLAFSRRQHLEPRAVNVAAVLDTLRDLIARSLGPGIDLRFEIEPDLPPAHVDPNQLELALLNLAVNARDAMGEEGVLTISATQNDWRDGRCIRIAVTDTGAGMDAKTLARAAEPFFTTKEVGRGTGLGLSSVKGLAEQSGGEFLLESEVGRGTTAILCLPIAAGPVEAEAEADKAAPFTGGRAVILLVDDEAGVRLGAAEMLVEAGYTVVEASGPDEALARVGDGLAYDLLITDYAMPGMTGARLASTLKAQRPDLPVLLTTGYASMREGDVEGLPRLAKPFRQTELISAVRAVLRR
jgi:PAS domain S-box-containing protein